TGNVKVVASTLLLTTTALALVATTVSVELCPVVTAAGLAEIWVVGGSATETVTVAVAVAGLLTPVGGSGETGTWVGATVCVPPAAGNVNLVASTLSVITTPLAPVAVTVRVVLCPFSTVAGLAAIWTVRAPETVMIEVAVAVVFPSAPVAVAV